MSKSLIRTAVCSAVLAAAGAAAHAGAIVLIDPDGPGPGGTIAVGSLDWAVGNSIAVANPGESLGAGQIVLHQTLTAFAHAGLGSFLDADGTPIGGLMLNAPGGYEWTFVTRFVERVSSVGPIMGDGSQTLSLQILDHPLNIFEIWYDPTRNASNLTGRGFSDGTLILTATSAGGTAAYTSQFGLPPVNLDGFGVNNYSGYQTVQGGGNTSVQATVASVHPAFFPGLMSGTQISFDFTSEQRLNYNNQNPSSCFWNFGAGFFTGAGNGIAGGCGTAGDFGSIGPVNAFSGPNTMFQTDASTSFDLVVPEPGSLALVGLALAGLAAAGRRRQPR